MKKTRKYFIIILAFVVVFAAGIGILKLTEKPNVEEDPPVSSAVDNTIAIVEKTIGDIKSLTVEKAIGSKLTLHSSYDEENKSVTVTVDGINEKVMLDKNLTQIVLTYGYKLSATKNIGPQGDLNQYGLITPAATVTAEFQDGEKLIYYIGAENPNGGYYTKIKGKDDIYICSFSKEVFFNATDLITLNLTDIPTTSYDDETTNAATCHSLTIGGTNYEEEIKIELSEVAEIHSSHIMTQPTRGEDYYCDDEYINNIILKVSLIKASEAVSIEPSQEDLEKYGLDNPAAYLDFKVSYLEGETENDVKQTYQSHKIYCGTQQDDGRFPIMIDDNPVIFLVSDTVVNRWYQIDPFIMRSTFIILPVITKVETVTVSYDGEVHKFEMPRTLKESPSANSSLLYEYTVSNTQGEELTYKNFQKYYRALLTVTLLGDTQEEPAGEPVFTVKYDFYEDKEGQTVSYYEIPNNTRQYIVALNGSVYGVVRRTEVDQLYKATEDIENDICELI